jgi:hypothetical protein
MADASFPRDKYEIVRKSSEEGLQVKENEILITGKGRPKAAVQDATEKLVGLSEIRL